LTTDNESNEAVQGAFDHRARISSPYLIPTVALVDPLMTLKMPRRITAATGLDAFTHAIEARAVARETTLVR
jgi:alcohol dehydrogenase class IV